MERSTIMLIIYALLAPVAGCGTAVAPAPPSESARAASAVEQVNQVIQPAVDSPPMDSIPVDAPSRDQVVSAGAAVSPTRACAGETVTFALRLRIADGWHIGAVQRSPSVGPVLPTKLELRLPENVSAIGDWRLPGPVAFPGPPPQKVYEGDVRFERELRISGDAAPGQVLIPCVVTYQSCTEKLCLRPMPIEVIAELAILNSR